MGNLSKKRIRVLFFATLRDRAGLHETMIELPFDATINDLKTLLLSMYPGLQEALKTTLTSINKEFAPENIVIPENSEVAFFPPVSGGNSDFPGVFKITEDTLDINNLLTLITLPSTGAAAIFTGMVRSITNRGEAHTTSYLEYEAYKPMAEAKMRQVADEIRKKWPTIEGIAIVQRVGRLYPGTPTVLIACTAPHRDTGVFEAARYGIDRLKEIVPVWKKEIGPGGDTWIEGDYYPKQGE